MILAEVRPIAYYLNMGNQKKVLWKILQGTSDANIRFSDLRSLLMYLGFEERVKGSHHLFRKSGIDEKINIQKDGNKAKPYQVHQVRKVMLKYKFGDTCDD